MELFLCTLKWSLVTGAAALILRLLRPALDRRYRARWRCWVWLILSFALLLGPAAEHLLTTKSAAAAPPVIIQVPEMDVLWQMDRETGIHLQVLPASATEPHINTPAAASTPTSTPQTAPASQPKTLSASEVIPILWLAGAALFLLWRLLGTALFCRKARRWSRRPNDQTQQIYQQTCAALHIAHPPALLISSPVGSPMMTGLLRPRLYLPAEDWAPQELAFILRHELTHYRRHDLWYKLLVLLANALHWFNPCIYLLSREAEMDLELTCDDAVVAGSGRETRQAYSETLLASLHRQRGLSRAALSTHFYGGKQVMKSRFRNILSQNKRRFGITALLLALLLTGCAAAALGFQQQEAPPRSAADVTGIDPTLEPVNLTPPELYDWEDRLNTRELNGFVTTMYSDIRYLLLANLFYNHPGDPLTDSERTAYQDAWGMEPPDLDVAAITRQEAEDFLAEYTGLTLSDFPGGLDAQWTYSPENDRWFTLRGDTTYSPVTVTGGVRLGDSIILTLKGQFANNLTLGNLTITDGKFASFTTSLYTEVETLALEHMNGAFSWLETEEFGVTFTERCLTGLTCVAYVAVGDEVYTAWAPTYLLHPEDPSKVPLVGPIEVLNGWLLHYDGPGEPILIVSTKHGQTHQLHEWADTSVEWEKGYTWEEWIVAHTCLGMDLPMKVNGWPEATTEFIPSIAAGNEEWCTNWETTAERYLQQKGRTLQSDGLTIERYFYPYPGYNENQSLLIRALCAEGEYLLFLNQIDYYYGTNGQSSVIFWQVLGEAAAGDTPSTRWTYSPDGPEATHFTAGGMDLAITNVADIKRETTTDDTGETIECMIYVCSPGAMVYVQNAGMFETEDGLHPDWAFDHAAQGRIDIVNDMDPLPVDGGLIGVYDPESSLYVLKFEPAE